VGGGTGPTPNTRGKKRPGRTNGIPPMDLEANHFGNGRVSEVPPARGGAPDTTQPSRSISERNVRGGGKKRPNWGVFSTGVRAKKERRCCPKGPKETIK